MKKQTQKLPKAFKKKWVAALRSGKYKQGNNKLAELTSGGVIHCCLGVACEVAGSKTEKLYDYGVIYKDIAKNKYIPKLLKGTANKDFKPFNPIVKKLVDMNDGGKSFKYIASYIERYL